MNPLLIRLASANDASACAAIYRPYVTDSWASFELDPPDDTEIARRIVDYGSSHAWFVDNAVRDAVWSTAVQHGPKNALVVRAMGVAGPDDRALLIALYAERGWRLDDGNLAHFSTNSPAVQAGVAARFWSELKDALAMLDAAAA